MEITQYSNKQEINGPNLACCMCIQMVQEKEIEAALKLPLYNHEFPQAFNLFPFFFLFSHLTLLSPNFITP